MSFYEWLDKHYNDNCVYSDLYYDAKGDEDFPKDASDKDIIYNYLVCCHACKECLEAFNAAYGEYSLEMMEVGH